MNARTETVASSQKRDTFSYPPDLHHIKTLFLQRQYRQSINSSRQALHPSNDGLQEPLARNTFINFYLGLAHDEVARALHEHSQAKLPAFNRAEQYYHDAINALPSMQLCRATLLPEQNDQQSALPFTSDFQLFESAPERQPSAPSVSPMMSSSPFPDDRIASEDDMPARSTTDDEVAESDSSDLSSHDSFNDIVTPQKLLRRDVSRMSLLDKPLQRDFSSMSLLDVRPRLVKSTSQGLLRPIRPGSPPKQYHLPPKLPYVGRNPSQFQTPSLPAVQTPESPTRRSRKKLPSYQVSPVSPLGFEGITSDLSTISPVSPQAPGPEEITKSDALVFDPDLSQLEEHLEAMHAQLQTHLRLLQSARLATTIAQAERAARSAPTVGNPLGHISNDSGISGGRDTASDRLSLSRSFWSFTPVDVKAVDKQRRIEAGRARGWRRQRFRPERYQDLAEKALSEL